MQWYEKQFDVEGTPVTLEGTFEDSILRIAAIIEIDPDDVADGFKYYCLYEKPVNIWAHQEILAEDILSKYEGMVRKCENKLPSLVERYKLNKRI